MAKTPEGDQVKWIAVQKVIYLLAVTAAAFTIPTWSLTRPFQWILIPALLAIQVFILLLSRVSAHEIVRPAWRLKWLFALLLVAYALLPSDTPSDIVYTWHLPNGWRVPINLTGLQLAALMCLQIITVLLASAFVRLTGDGNDLVDGLRAFRLPPLFVYSLDQTLELLGGAQRRGGGRGSGGGRRDGRGDAHAESAPQLGFFGIVKRLLRGDIGGLVQAIERNIRIASERSIQKGAPQLSVQMAHDVAVISGIALCMASLKILKFLPGVPFASGHKGLLLIPLYILAARLTYSRWGGTVAGAIMGLIGFLQGDGRFGILEVLKHVAPGVVVDLADPLMRRLTNRAFSYCLLGLAAAVARTTTEFIVIFFLGARVEVYLFPAARLVPNLVAGFLSGFVTFFLLRAFKTSLSSAEKESDVPANTTVADRGIRSVDLSGSADEEPKRRLPSQTKEN
jgi:hypothetical protein